eukprot:Colp12_sorted_trinity150504_noHs@5854
MFGLLSTTLRAASNKHEACFVVTRAISSYKPGVDTYRYLNTPLSPSKATEGENEWIVLAKAETMKKYPAGGKWLIYALNGEEHDQMFAKARLLYDADQLPGVHSVATPANVPFSIKYSKEYKPIEFFCGPFENAEHVTSIGAMLLSRFPEFGSRDGKFYYKSDAKTERGSQASKARGQHFDYRMPCRLRDSQFLKYADCLWFPEARV